MREGGLSAILTYLDFFSTNVQRTAVTTAANCCRNISIEHFGMVRDVMPILRNVLAYPDQRVVEGACLAVTRTLDSYRHHPDKIEALATPELLSAICTLLLPEGGGSTIGQATYSQLLKSFATASKASPEVSLSLVDKNIASTVFYIDRKSVV